MCRKKYKKGTIYHSPINYKRKDGKKVGAHNVVVCEDTNSGKAKTKLLTHSREHSHQVKNSDFSGKGWRPDKKTRISKDKFTSIMKFARKKKNIKYIGD